ncbi:hypothetical protein V6Z90_009877 [Aspergillus fumigatus]
MPSRHESSARADYVPALCTHRPSLLPIEWLGEASDWLRGAGNDSQSRKVGQTRSFRGSKSRNKVSVGEPAEGSLPSEGPLGPTSHPCLSYLVARRARRFDGRRGGLAPPARARRRPQHERCSEMNHRVFERTLRPLVFRGHACPSVIAALKHGLCVLGPVPLSRGTGPKGSGGTASGPRAYGALSPAL